jgi:hypothetical protein
MQLCLHRDVTNKSDSLPTNLRAAHLLIVAQREALVVAEARPLPRRAKRSRARRGSLK